MDAPNVSSVHPFDIFHAVLFYFHSFIAFLSVVSACSVCSVRSTCPGFQPSPIAKPVLSGHQIRWKKWAIFIAEVYTGIIQHWCALTVAAVLHNTFKSIFAYENCSCLKELRISYVDILTLNITNLSQSGQDRCLNDAQVSATFSQTLRRRRKSQFNISQHQDYMIYWNR